MPAPRRLLTILLTGLVPALVVPAFAADGPSLVQKLLPGADGIPDLKPLGAPWRVGAFLYVPAGENQVLVFSVADDGKLTYRQALVVKVEQGQAVGYMTKVVGDRLYAVERIGKGYQSRTFVSASLAVYEFDAKTGDRKELGRAACPETAGLALSADGRTAYLLPKAPGTLLRFGIDEKGAVAKAGEDSNDAFVGQDLQFSPDGKQLYWQHAAFDKEANQDTTLVQIADVKADGSVAWRKSVTFKAPNPGQLHFHRLTMSPDGGHLYLYAWGYTRGNNFAPTYARDPKSGDLTPLEAGNDFSGKMFTIDFLTPELGVCRSWKFGEASAITLFRRDVKTGQLTDCGDIPGVTRIGWISWAGVQYDAKLARLYVTGNDMNKGLRGVYVVALKPDHWTPKAKTK
ncbi:MAG: hypothetical protein BIFFINMI_02977 [Phycisphaerae bacterium]|nr:hypothetical protein [Phycisphaerae bacterium]